MSFYVRLFILNWLQLLGPGFNWKLNRLIRVMPVKLSMSPRRGGGGGLSQRLLSLCGLP